MGTLLNGLCLEEQQDPTSFSRIVQSAEPGTRMANYEESLPVVGSVEAEVQACSNNSDSQTEGSGAPSVLETNCYIMDGPHVLCRWGGGVDSQSTA